MAALTCIGVLRLRGVLLAAEPHAVDHVGREGAHHGAGRGERARRLLAVPAQRGAQQREIHRVARDARPDPLRRPALAEDADACGDLAHAHRAHPHAAAGVVAHADHAVDAPGHEDLRDAEGEAEDAEALGDRATVQFVAHCRSFNLWDCGSNRRPCGPRHGVGICGRSQTPSDVTMAR
jgi:hypothetical protein